MTGLISSGKYLRGIREKALKETELAQLKTETLHII